MALGAVLAKKKILKLQKVVGAESRGTRLALCKVALRTRPIWTFRNVANTFRLPSAIFVEGALGLEVVVRSAVDHKASIQAL
jgi:hypothetical protein